MAESMPAVATRDLCKQYGDVLAVNGLSITIDRGSIFGLIGPNGAGKTTTIKMLIDLVRPSGGTVEVLGRSPRQAGAELRKDIGYLPGELKVSGRMTGHRWLGYMASLSGPVDRGTPQNLAERLSLDLNRPIGTLSKGNKQKLGIIQAFMHKPHLLILDEPTSGLDPLVQREFLAMVREVAGEGNTVLLSSHVLSEIQQCADKVAVLANGKVVTQGGTGSLRLSRIRHINATIIGNDVSSWFSEFPTLTIANLPGTVSRWHVSGTWTGNIKPLLDVLTKTEVESLTIEEPDLEESVLSLYQTTTNDKEQDQ